MCVITRRVYPLYFRKSSRPGGSISSPLIPPRTAAIESHASKSRQRIQTCIRRARLTAFDGYTNVEWVTSAPTFSHALMVIIAGRHALLSLPRGGGLTKTEHTHAHGFEYHEGGTTMSTECATRCKRVGARITKQGVPLAELTRRVPLNVLACLFEVLIVSDVSSDSNEFKCIQTNFPQNIYF
ncbi:uncharacterized protein LOC118647578 [Monomorium pharaonis]|uniref:uncharacterized protein LOC118647578 n=1 Tax=Monomorium pharaonis TaxID=307658 RepID=UPI001746E2D0|nr:uncharacterized protein LOC118647578 [Monomorium pharaonis]